MATRSLPLVVRGAATAVLAVLPLAVPAAAAAAEPDGTGGGPVPVELSVELSGPAEGTAGGTGAWTITVSNSGSSAADTVRVALQLPDGVELRSVAAADGWSCVLSPMSCRLDAALPPGRSAPALPVELGYAASASGARELAALAYQGEDGPAMRIDRGAATVVLSPAPAEPAPAGEPPAQAPAGQAPAAQPGPAAAPGKTVAEALAAKAPAAKAAAPAPAPAGAAADAGEPASGATSAAAAANPVADLPADAPAALPFVAGETVEDIAGVAASTSAADEGSGAPLVLLVGLAVVAALAGGAGFAVRRARAA